MRISKLSIEGFRSINSIVDFQFLDQGITCFIGPNGSGKSNILKAINVVLNDYKFEDVDYFEQEGEKSISIKLDISFEQSINNMFDEEVPNLSGVKKFGFSLSVSENEESTLEVYPVEGEEDFSPEGIITIFKLIQEEMDYVELQEVFGDRVDEINRVINDSIIELKGNSYSIKAELNFLLEIFSSMVDEMNAIKKIYLSLTRIQDLINLHNSIYNLKDEISIELLDFSKGYEVEDEVSPDELLNNKSHPFLFDLLNLSGKNANNFINRTSRTILNNCKRASEEITHQLNKYWPSHNVQYSLTPVDGRLFFSAYTPQGELVGLSQLSDGEKWYLRFYTKLAIEKGEGGNVIWLFDEPGRDLHSSSQIDLKTFFEDVAKDSQIIYTTHQPMMIQWHKLERLFVVENIEHNSPLSDELGIGTVIHKRFWKDVERNGETVSPLREALALIVGEEMLTGKEHVVVEGISDYFYLSGWIRYFQNSLASSIWLNSYGPSNRTIIPVDGVDKIPIYVLFLTRKLANRINCIGIPDSASKAEEIRELCGSRRGLTYLRDRTISLAELSGYQDLVEIERLFDPNDFVNLTLEYYDKFFKEIVLPDNLVIPSDLSEFDCKITKYIEHQLRELNQDFPSLDKTGIAMYAYRKLAQAKTKALCPFKTNTRDVFHKVLNAIDKAFRE